jgi:hypothetical protein
MASAARSLVVKKEDERTRRWTSLTVKGRETHARQRGELLNRWGQAQLLIKEVTKGKFPSQTTRGCS